MSIKKFLKTCTLTTVLVAATVLAQTPYDEGQKALREQNWSVAAEYFKQAIKTDKDTADASMYWRAHALYKAGRKTEAERQVGTLERKYPDSRWVKEAGVLQIEHDDAAAVLAGTTDASGMDDELRMFALAQLMERDPERALPLVLDMLKSTDSESTRRDALFLLGMSDEPKAQEAIAQIARDSKDPKLQADAIHMLGISSSQPSMALLASLYQESASVEAKRAVIEAYLLAGDTQILRQVLETETDPELRKTAIRGIAMEDDEGTAALLESIYDKAGTVEEKKVILESLVMMDDAQDLVLKIVRTETEIELRREAIHLLGVMEATGELGALYANIEPMELRKVILESMMIADDIDGLQKVLQTEENAELRAQAIQMLAVSEDEDAAQYLLGLYPGASRTEKQAVIQSMMIMENVESLIGLLKTETDPELKREMLQTLTIMDSEESDRYLFEMLENKG